MTKKFKTIKIKHYAKVSSSTKSIHRKGSIVLIISGLLLCTRLNIVLPGYQLKAGMTPPGLYKFSARTTCYQEYALVF